MIKRLAHILLLSFVVLSGVVVMYGAGMKTFMPSAGAQATRTFNSPRKTRRLLAKQHNSNNDVFPTADPSPAGTPLTLSNAMGISGSDGSVTLLIGAGFTAPVALTVYQWNADYVNTSKSGWYRIAPAATGSDVYTKSVDTNYALVQFSIAEDTPFLIRADKSVTGDVYTDAASHPSNTGSTATGYSN